MAEAVALIRTCVSFRLDYYEVLFSGLMLVLEVFKYFRMLQLEFDLKPEKTLTRFHQL